MGIQLPHLLPAFAEGPAWQFTSWIALQRPGSSFVVFAIFLFFMGMFLAFGSIHIQNLQEPPGWRQLRRYSRSFLVIF